MKTENLIHFPTFSAAESAALSFFVSNCNYDSKRVDFEPFRQDDGSHIYQFYAIDNPSIDDVFECTIEGQ